MSLKQQLAVLSLGFLALASSSPALAATHYKPTYKSEERFALPSLPVHRCKNLNDGFYAGGSVGYDMYNVNVNTNLTFNGVAIGGNPPVSAMGFIGAVMGGYGIYLADVYYVGAELFANSSSAAANITNTNSSSTYVYSTKFTAGTGYGLSLLPGFKVNDSSLFYLRFGYNWTRLKGEESVIVGPASESTSRAGWQSGFNYGLGIETAVHKRISVRGEYTYTSYDDFVSPYKTTWSPSNNQFMLSAIYHFEFLF